MLSPDHGAKILRHLPGLLSQYSESYEISISSCHAVSSVILGPVENRDLGPKFQEFRPSAFTGKHLLASFRRGRLDRRPGGHPMANRDVAQKLASLGYLPNRAILPKNVLPTIVQQKMN